MKHSFREGHQKLFTQRCCSWSFSLQNTASLERMMEFDMEDILRQKRRHCHLHYDSSSCVWLCASQNRDRSMVLCGLEHILKGSIQEAFKHVLAYRVRVLFQSMPTDVCLHPKMLGFKLQSFRSENVSWCALALAHLSMLLCPPA